MTESDIQFHVDAGVATLTLSRPDVLNCLTIGMLERIAEAFESVGNDSTINVLVLTGSGRAFCSGADLADIDIENSTPSKTGNDIYDAMVRHFNPVVQSLRDLRVPTIACVNGIAAGGGASLALNCDIVIAARSATFQQVFIPNLGLIPDLGGSWLLPRSLGRARAIGTSFLGKPVDAETAERWGMIWKCVPDDALETETSEIAGQLKLGPAESFVAARKAFDQSSGNSFAEQLALEARTQRKLSGTSSFRDKVLSFLKRS